VTPSWRGFSPDEHSIVMRGLVVQPFLAGVLAFLMIPPSQLAVVIAVFVAVVSVILTGCVAYPLLLWFVRRGRLTWMHTLASGAVITRAGTPTRRSAV
jgi:hypothetical protein